MKASLLKTRHSNGESRRSRINYKILTFLMCLVIAGFLWFMNMLSKKYTDTITFQVQYQHLPQDKKLSPSSATVNVKVVASGFNIAAYTFGIKEALINFDAAQFRHKDNQYLYSLENKTHLEKMEEQLGDMKVIDVAPDTLYLRPIPTQTSN
jgi:hypothetical protein